MVWQIGGADPWGAGLRHSGSSARIGAMLRRTASPCRFSRAAATSAEEWKACREAIRAYYLGLRWGGMNQAEAAEKTNIPRSTGNG